MRTCVSIAVMAATTLLLGSVGKAQTSASDITRRTGQMAEANERHPEMRLALHHLRQAKRELERSAHDYAGHRLAALKCTETAIQQVVDGLKGDGNALIPSSPLADANGGPGGGRWTDANEHHPEMRKAVFHLREAKRELERSAHDYEGHRAAALKDAEQAIKEVVEGLKSDGT